MKNINEKFKCKDCRKKFGSGYLSSVEDNRIMQCDEFEWCWNCDDKHTEEEIKNGM